MTAKDYLLWLLRTEARCTAWSNSAVPWPPSSASRRCTGDGRPTSSSWRCRRPQRTWPWCEAGRSEGRRERLAPASTWAPCSWGPRPCTRSWREARTGKRQKSFFKWWEILQLGIILGKDDDDDVSTKLKTPLSVSFQKVDDQVNNWVCWLTSSQGINTRELTQDRRIFRQEL